MLFRSLWFSRSAERPAPRRYVRGITAERLLSRNLCSKATRNPPRGPEATPSRGGSIAPFRRSLSNRLLLARRANLGGVRVSFVMFLSFVLVSSPRRASGMWLPVHISSSAVRHCPAPYQRVDEGGWVDYGPSLAHQRPSPSTSTPRLGRAQSFANHSDEDGVS